MPENPFQSPETNPSRRVARRRVKTWAVVVVFGLGGFLITVACSLVGDWLRDEPAFNLSRALRYGIVFGGLGAFVAIPVGVLLEIAFPGRPARRRVPADELGPQ